ncbi:MAG: hypothetical protein KDB03_02195 [Planctomycetales bacterium]|nr:hypothetical protein [Planctomycetales bacterium]
MINKSKLVPISPKLVYFTLVRLPYMQGRFNYGLAIVLYVLLTTFSMSQTANGGRPEGATAGFGKPREWTDSTGKFKIQGALSLADPKEVQIKTNQGRELKIELNKLSESDQAFVKSFLEVEAAMGGGPSPENPFREIGDQTSNSVPDPVALDTKAVDTSIPVRQVQDRATRPIPLSFEKTYWDGTPPVALEILEVPDLNIRNEIQKNFFAGWYVQTAGRNPVAVLNVEHQGRDGNYSQYSVVSLESGEGSPPTKFEDAYQLKALSPNGAQLAAVRVVGFGKGNDLIMMQVTRDGVHPVFEFKAGGGSWDELQSVQFLPNNRLLTVSQKHNVTIWDLNDEKAVRPVSRGNLGGPAPIAVSDGTDRIAIAGRSAVAVLDTLSMKQVGCIHCEKEVLAMDFSHEGSSLAVQVPFELQIYSLQDGKLVKTIPIANERAAAIRCLGAYVLVDGLLFDVEAGTPLWNYEFPQHYSLLGNLLVATFPGEKGTQISTVHLPHPDARSAMRDLSNAQLYAVIPGTPVKLTVEIQGGDKTLESGVREALEANIQKAGWSLSNSANIQISASLNRGEQKQEDYYTTQGRFGIPPPMFRNPTGPKETVTYTPWTHKVEISQGSESLYSNSLHVGSPDNFSLKDGETTQAAVTRLTQPRVDYFRNLTLPPYLWKPEYRHGFGKSKITPDGLR